MKIFSLALGCLGCIVKGFILCMLCCVVFVVIAGFVLALVAN